MKNLLNIFLFLVCYFLSPSSWAATLFDVNTTSDLHDQDTKDGQCLTSTGGCSLRAAVEQSLTLNGDVNINLVNNIYPLSLGVITLDTYKTGTLNIIGANPTNTVIMGNGTSRLFIAQDSVNKKLKISHLTLSKGGNGYLGGGLMLKAINATFDNVIMKNNQGTNGGAMAILEKAEVTTNNVEFSSNSANYGGAVYVGGGTAHFNSTLFLSNSATGSALGNHGGAIHINTSQNSTDNTVTLHESALIQNTATSCGGGLVAINPTSSIYKVRVELVNTTISGNQAGIGGGISLGGCGLAANKTTLSLHNATITLNKANSGAGVYFNGSALSLANSVLAANTDLAPGGGTGGTDPDCGGPSQIISNGYNLIGLKGTCNLKSGTGDLIGINNALDPGLASLNPSWIHGQKEGSQTIDAGNPAGCLDENKAILKTDQRLSPRPVKGTPSPSAVCDIGAVEFDPAMDQDKDGVTSLHGDCNDFDATFSPDEFDTCGDGIDTNCDGSDINCQNIDQDGDGFTPAQNDCNDFHAGINPNASDYCGDNLDANCSGDETDAVDIKTFYADNDGDGFGNPQSVFKACLQPDQFVTNHSDCNDNQATINPNAKEICGDTIDSDCNGSDLDCSTVDADLDGFTPAAGDCNDGDAGINPNAVEVCDGKDNNCTGGIDENSGQTTCGEGVCQRIIDNCLNGQEQQCVAGTAAEEICGNNIDEDCNGSDLTCPVPAPADPISNESNNDTQTSDTDNNNTENDNTNEETNSDTPIITQPETPAIEPGSSGSNSGGGCSLQKGPSNKVFPLIISAYFLITALMKSLFLKFQTNQ